MSLIHLDGVEELEGSTMEQVGWKSQICTDNQYIPSEP